MEIRFKNGFHAWSDFKQEVKRLIVEHDLKDIAEIGGGANPLLTSDFIAEQELEYHVMDISVNELAKACDSYKKIEIDLEKPLVGSPILYDFIFAQMTLEHIREPRAFYSNVNRLLKPGGQAFFFFACKTSLPSFINMLIPETISEKILLKLQPFRRHEKHGKFKAYYKWCFGPTRKNINRFKALNFVVASYIGYFGHSYYHRIKPLDFIERTKTKLLLKNPKPYLCSYAHVVIKK